MKKNLTVIFMTTFLVFGIYALIFGLTTVFITHLLTPLICYLGLPALTYKIVLNTLLAFYIIALTFKAIK